MQLMSSKYSTRINELNENTSHAIILSNIKAGCDVLECGCSSGYMTRYMSERLNANVSIVEINEDDYSQAIKYAEDGTCTDLERREWIGYFEGKRFDYILFADVLEHLRNPKDVLTWALGLLRENGIIIASVPNVAHHDILINLLNNRWNYMEKGILDDSHVHFWAQQNLDGFFRNAGLIPVIKDYVILPAFKTEQRSSDDVTGLLPGIYSICNRRYGDVYQFVYFLQKADYVRSQKIECTDYYDDRHQKYGIHCPYSDEYTRQREYEANKIEEQSNWILHQDEVIRELERKNSSLTGQNNALISQNNELNTRLDRERLSANRLKIQNDTLVEENNRLQSRYDILSNDYNSINAKYEAISTAFFWKVTKPARVTLDFMKDRFRGNEPMRRLWVKIKGVKEDEERRTLFYSPGNPVTLLCTNHTRFVAMLMQRELQKVGIESDIQTEEPKTYGEQVYFVICPQMFKQMPGRYISLQMEQTISSRWLTKDYYDRLGNSFAVLDYSLVNIEYFRRNTGFGKMFYYLPIDYLPGMKVPGLKTSEYKYDVLFYGDPNNPRRRFFLKELSKKFSVKCVSEVFGDQLYEMLQQAKVVVNIHYHENALLETTRIYETLSIGRSIIISERSGDKEEEKRLEGIVDFVSTGDIESMVKRIDFWLKNEDRRISSVKENNKKLLQRANSFSFFFMRFLLANEWISFDEFYKLAGDYIHFNNNKICLSLPETTERRREFIQDNQYGFEMFPGLRHQRGWTGCGLSYKFIMKKAKEQEIDKLLVCEDDVLFPEDFIDRWSECERYLDGISGWDVFQGLIAIVDNITITGVKKSRKQTFVHINRIMSMVFNYYNSSVYNYFIDWDETDTDVDHNTIDQAVNKKKLNVVTTTPFLVGHKEDLKSEIWGFKNTQYHNLIEESSRKLDGMEKQYIAGKKKMDRSH